MPQKFISLDEAAQQLGISKEHLGQLREEGKLRAYRDGASWKFRTEDIEQMATAGVPPLDPAASDLSLELDDLPDEASEEKSASSSGLDLDLADDESATPTSDIGLEEIDEPTVPASVSDAGLSDDLALDSGVDEDDLSESILLSEAELGTSSDRPPSTIIGKAELDPEGDLELAAESVTEPDASLSDVQLAPEPSDVLGIGGGSDDVLDSQLPSPSGAFDAVEELEIDLEAESSRILSPDDTSSAKDAAAAKAAADTGELGLAPGSSAANVSSDVGLGSDMGSGAGLTGLSALELEDDDQVLGEGSDITLSSESSGINIISPSDSGLALDEVPLDLSGGASLGSSLDLGEVGEEEDVPLEPLEISEAEAPEGSGVEAFQLTPLGEETSEDEKDSSQIIALDEISEEESAVAAAAAPGGADLLADEFGVAGLTGGGVAVAEPTVETPFSTPVIVFLGLCILLLAICGMMIFDLIRNIWSWDQVYSLNSSLMEMLYPLIN